MIHAAAFPYEAARTFTPESVEPGITFINRPSYTRIKIAFALQAFEDNVLSGHECSLIFKGGGVYLTSNDPQALIARTRVDFWSL